MKIFSILLLPVALAILVFIKLIMLGTSVENIFYWTEEALQRFYNSHFINFITIFLVIISLVCTIKYKNSKARLFEKFKSSNLVSCVIVLLLLLPCASVAFIIIGTSEVDGFDALLFAVLTMNILWPLFNATHVFILRIHDFEDESVEL